MRESTNAFSDLADQDKHRAREHVKLGEHLVAEQKRRVSELARHGASTEQALRLLATLEQALDTMQKHLATEEMLGRSAGFTAPSRRGSRRGLPTA
jgi:hypothetical protein